MNTDTDNLFRLNTLLLRYTYKKLAPEIYSHKKCWLGSCEGTSSVIEPSSHTLSYFLC